jgi:methyl-accepting chemotaxis protein
MQPRETSSNDTTSYKSKSICFSSVGHLLQTKTSCSFPNTASTEAVTGALIFHALDSRQQTADSRQQTADSRQQTADSRQQTADSIQQTAESIQQTADCRQQTADSRQQTADSRL